MIGLDIGDNDYAPTNEFVDPLARDGSYIRQMAVMNPRVPPKSKPDEMDKESGDKDKLDNDCVLVSMGKGSNFKGVAKARNSNSDKIEQMTANFSEITERNHRERMEMESKKLEALAKLASPSGDSDKTITIVDLNKSPFDYPIKFSEISELKKEIIEFCGMNRPEDIKGIVIAQDGRKTLLRFMSQITEDIQRRTLSVSETDDGHYIQLS